MSTQFYTVHVLIVYTALTVTASTCPVVSYWFNYMNIQTPTIPDTEIHRLLAVTDVLVTGENEFRIVSKLSRELIVAWPLFMKRINVKRLVCLVTISQQR